MGSFFEHGGASGTFPRAPVPDSCDALEPGNTGMSERGLNTVSFAGHAASSAQFKALYAEGMGLVEETASYLDGPGAPPPRCCAHGIRSLCCRSMRLTTRLMQMASWLLLQRAVNNGEMSREPGPVGKEQGAPGQLQRRPQARRAGTICRRASASSIERSLRLQNRVALPRPRDLSAAGSNELRFRTTRTAQGADQAAADGPSERG
ncbi:DUF1465 family protein [Sinorhizobium meliloti]|nr:DUF1465 family protein [Sinorhizobium meliloti]